MSKLKFLTALSIFEYIQKWNHLLPRLEFRNCFPWNSAEINQAWDTQQRPKTILFFGHLAGFDRKTEKPKNRRLWKIVISFFSGKCYSRFPSSSVRFDASPRRKKSSFESFRSGTSSGLKLGAGFSVVVMIRLGALELRFCFAAGSKLELKLLMA